MNPCACTPSSVNPSMSPVRSLPIDSRTTALTNSKNSPNEFAMSNSFFHCIQSPNVCWCDYLFLLPHLPLSLYELFIMRQQVSCDAWRNFLQSFLEMLVLHFFGIYVFPQRTHCRFPA